jgi:hypothetical protein
MPLQGIKLKVSSCIPLYLPFIVILPHLIWCLAVDLVLKNTKNIGNSVKLTWKLYAYPWAHFCWLLSSPRVIMKGSHMDFSSYEQQVWLCTLAICKLKRCNTPYWHVQNMAFVQETESCCMCQAVFTRVRSVLSGICFMISSARCPPYYIFVIYIIVFVWCC